MVRLELVTSGPNPLNEFLSATFTSRLNEYLFLYYYPRE